MIRREDEDGVALDLQLSECSPELADALVQGRAVGVVAGQLPPGHVGLFGRNVRPQTDFLGFIQCAESFRGRLIRVVRRAPRKHQQKRPPAGRVSPQVLDRVRRLRLCVVAVPLSLRRIVVLVIERPVVVVRTFQGLEVLEPLAPLGRDVRRAAVAVEVPLADVAGAVASPGKDLGDRHLLAGQLHVVEEHAVRQRPAARHHRRPVRAADRTGRDGMGELDCLVRQPIEVRRLHVRIARVPQRVGTPLVGEHEQDVGAACRIRGVGRTRNCHEDDGGRERQHVLQCAGHGQ